jgi:hypothetical protein
MGPRPLASEPPAGGAVGADTGSGVGCPTSVRTGCAGSSWNAKWANRFSGSGGYTYFAQATQAGARADAGLAGRSIGSSDRGERTLRGTATADWGSNPSGLPP